MIIAKYVSDHKKHSYELDKPKNNLVKFSKTKIISSFERKKMQTKYSVLGGCKICVFMTLNSQ